jgi:2-oxoglutarate dehydrogenase complex dehydrogenase (E1) component-like enzyme
MPLFSRNCLHPLLSKRIPRGKTTAKAKFLAQYPSPSQLSLLRCCTHINSSSPALRSGQCFSTSAAVIDDNVETLHENESFLTGTSSVYAEEMYERYTNDPMSVHESWKHYFDALLAGQPYDVTAYNKPTAAVVVGTTNSTVLKTKFATTNSQLSQSTVAAAAVAPSDSLGIAHLIRAYQVNGHLAAKLDPLETYAPESYPSRPTPVTTNPNDIDCGYPAELTPSYHGFHSSDLDRVMNFRGTSSGGNKGYLEDLANSPNKVTLRMILNELRKTYTGTLGVEYMVRTPICLRQLKILHHQHSY